MGLVCERGQIKTWVGGLLCPCGSVRGGVFLKAFGWRYLNGWLPPNVFYGEVDARGVKCRMKYAVLSLEDFERSVTGKVVSFLLLGTLCPANGS